MSPVKDWSKYPSDWKTVIRPAILERANDCCEVCGVANHTVIERTGKGSDEWVYWPEGMQGEAHLIDGHKPVNIVLTIAHLDHDVNNNQHSNLKALCQRCHLHYDIAHHKENSRNTRNNKKGLQNLF